MSMAQTDYLNAQGHVVLVFIFMCNIVHILIQCTHFEEQFTLLLSITDYY